MSLGFIIEDTQGWLSKAQKEKIKAWFRGHFDKEKKDYSEVLETIHYQDPTKGTYRSVELVEESPTLYKVRLGIILSTTDSARYRLHTKLRNKAVGRSSCLDREDLKMYHRLLQSADIQRMPTEVSFPDPDTVRRERAIYEEFVKMCPNPTLKEYFSLCLN
jgi:hypothetical protein